MHSEHFIQYFKNIDSLYRNKGVMVIGSGQGECLELFEALNVKRAVLVEADKEQIERMFKQYDLPQRYIVENMLIGQESDTVDFYIANNPEVSGITPIDSYCKIMPNVTLTQTQTMPSYSIDTLLKRHKAQKINWLFVDTFDTLAILKDSKNVFETMEVVVCKVLYRDLNALHTKMKEEGFVLSQTWEDLHPEIILAVFIKDYKGVQKKLRVLKEKYEIQKDTLKQQKARIAKLKEKSKKRKEAFTHLHNEKERLDKELERYKSELEKKSLALNELEKNLQAEQNSFHREQQRLTQKIEAMKELLNTQEETVLKAEEEKKHLVKDIEKKKDDLENLANEVRIQKELLEKSEEEKRELEKAIVQLQQAMKDEENKQRLLDQESEKKSIVVRELEKELEDEKAVFERDRQTLLQEIEKLENELKNYQDKQLNKDDDIEEFINDILPFYYGKNVTYVDIGAFKGEVFLKLKKQLRIREAHLFEPNPKSYEVLKKNIENVNIPLLHMYNSAIGKKREKRFFAYEGSMTKHVNIPKDQMNKENFFKVDVYPLHSFMDTITDKHINILKIDVEGSELDTLKGAKDFLKNDLVDVIYIEIGFNKNGTQQTYFSDIDIFMQGLNYRIFKIYEQVNEWVSDSPLLRRANIAYMSDSFAKKNSYKVTQENYKLKQKLEGR